MIKPINKDSNLSLVIICDCCFSGDKRKHSEDCEVCKKIKKQNEDGKIPEDDILNIYNKLQH